MFSNPLQRQGGLGLSPLSVYLFPMGMVPATMYTTDPNAPLLATPMPGAYTPSPLYTVPQMQPTHVQVQPKLV